MAGFLIKVKVLLLDITLFLFYNRNNLKLYNKIKNASRETDVRFLRCKQRKNPRLKGFLYAKHGIHSVAASPKFF